MYHSCNSKAYKKAKRNEKIEAVIFKVNPTNPPNHKSSIISYGALNQKDCKNDDSNLPGVHYGFFAFHSFSSLGVSLLPVQ